MCEIDCYVTLAQYIALLFMVLAWYAYRKAHPEKSNPRFRVEQVTFEDGLQVYRCSRRWPLNQWRTFEIEEGISEYHTMEEAENAMNSYLSNLGFDMTETKVLKAYTF